jgi:hypothetical protein
VSKTHVLNARLNIGTSELTLKQKKTIKLTYNVCDSNEDHGYNKQKYDFSFGPIYGMVGK